ncbi:WD40-repeat-containing domain protein [Suillus occidentalis]|nr:WD40-repeat-containing domain protein [Suillus occidentalis]
MTQLILNPKPLRLFEDREWDDGYANAIAVSSDGRRMVTASTSLVRLWDMREGILLKRLQGHARYKVNALAVSRDGRLIASGDGQGRLIAWDLNIGEPLTQPIIAHTSGIPSLAFSPDATLLATSSGDGTTKLWSTKTWELLGNPITYHTTNVCCVRFSPSGALLAIATHTDIKIYDLGTRGCVESFKGHAAFNGSYNKSLAWMPDGTRLFSAGGDTDPTIREWDTSNWKQVGEPWKGHFKSIQAISLNSTGTLLASASDDNGVRLWRVSDQRTIVVFKHCSAVQCVSFSADDRRILSGDQDKAIFEWPVPEDALPDTRPKNGPNDDSKDIQKVQMMHQAQVTAYSDFKACSHFVSHNVMQTGLVQVLDINTDVRNACITGKFQNTLRVLDRDIKADANNHASYTNRAFVMVRQSHWDRALHDAIKSVRIQPSFAGHIAKGIALCGKRQIRAARTAFDLASAFTNGDLKATHFLFLIKAGKNISYIVLLLHYDFQTIALFNAGEHEEAMLRVEELAASPNVDTLACRVVEAYLRVQLGTIAISNERHNEAVDHFTAAVNASAFFYKLAIHSTYEEFVMLFGWDLQSLWLLTNQYQCHALFRVGRIGAAVESYQSTMDKSDDDTKARLSDWFAEMAQCILNPTHLRLFKDDEQHSDDKKHTKANGQEPNQLRANAIAVSPDRKRMVTASWSMVRLWDMKEGILLKRLEEHRSSTVDALGVSRDGRFIASGDDKGILIAWDLSIGESLTHAIKAHTGSTGSGIPSLAFSPDSSLLATSSRDGTIKLWSTKTWDLQGNPIALSNTSVCCIRFSPSGALLAIATHTSIKIYDVVTRGRVESFKGHAAFHGSYNNSLAWMPDGTRLFSAGNDTDPTIREWDTSNWRQVGDPWRGHFKSIRAICLNSNGTLLASASDDNGVRLWRVSDRRIIVVFKHHSAVQCVSFSADDRRILSGDQDKAIFEWAVPEEEQIMHQPALISRHVPTFVSYTVMQTSLTQVLAINPDVRNACITGNFRTALTVLDKDIKTDANNHASYANRAFVMARKSDWDHALRDANKSVKIQPSFAGHISKGISLCGKKQVQAARISFDLASLFTNGDLKTDHFLFLIRARHTFLIYVLQAMLRIGELAACPNVDPVACRVVEAYLRVQLGNMALDGARHNEAVEHFTAAVNASASFSKLSIHSMYEEFVVLFGWDLKSLWQTANKQQCLALFRAGSFGAGIKAYQSIMDNIDEDMKADLHTWFAALK